MRKNLFFILISILFINCKQSTKAQQPQENVIKTAIVDVDSSEVREIVSFLASDELKGRDTGSEGLEKAAQFIEKKFETYAIAPFFKTYKDVFDVEGSKTYNVVGYLEGTDPQLSKEIIILGAHYDHIGTADAVAGDAIANGANDNAAGSAAVILLAKQLAQLKNNKRSILFVLFGAEEKGLLGSKHLAKFFHEEELDLYAMVNFEMIGVPLNNKPYKAYITGYEMSNMAKKMNEYANADLIGYLEKVKEYQLFKRSDNYPFYKKLNVPCQTISTFDFTNYDYYHHVDDEEAHLNFGFMAELINDCAKVIDKMANTPDKEIKLN